MSSGFWRVLTRRFQTWRKAYVRHKRYATVPLDLSPKDFVARLKAIDAQLDKEYTMPAVPEAYCMKCQAMRGMKHPLPAMLGKGGRPAIKGNCVVCNTKTSRILRRGEHAD